MTLTQAIEEVRRRTDTQENQVVTDAEVTSYINLSQQELYGLLIQTYGADYALSSGSLTYTGSSNTVALPSDFFKLRGVDVLTGGQYVTIKPFNLEERNLLANIPNSIGAPWFSALRYRLSGNNLWIEPLPPACTVRLWYAPKLTALSAGTDALIGYNGWEEYTIVDASIKVMQKQDLDVKVLFAQKGALIQRLNSEMENRDAGSPATVSDVYATGNAANGSGYGGFGAYGGGWWY